MASRAPGVRATLRAIAAPRRLVPTLLVMGSLLWAQAAYSDVASALPIGAALCLAFVFIAPVSWRVLFHERQGSLHTLAMTALYGAIGMGVVSTIGYAIPHLLSMGATLLTQPVNLLVALALFLVGGWGLGRDISLEEALRATAARADDEAQRATAAQLLALRAQLDPHFLFNTLNAIAEWCVTDGAVAERAVLRLSAMLRAVLAGVRARDWSLAEELALVDALCELHQLRDPRLFQLARSIDGDLAAARVPPLLLLPLVENAIKHGPAAGHRGRIDLEVAPAAGGLRIAIGNPGPYRGPRPGSDGLPTLEKRLQLAYAQKAALRIFADGPTRTRVELALPLTPEEATPWSI